MKQYLLVTFFCMLGITFSKSTHAISIIYPGSATSAINDWKNLKVREFILLSSKDFSKITGKRMNLKEWISFTFMKARMKHALKKNPNITVSEYLVMQKVDTGGMIFLIIIGAIVILLLIVLILFKYTW